MRVLHRLYVRGHAAVSECEGGQGRAEDAARGVRQQDKERAVQEDVGVGKGEWFVSPQRFECSRPPTLLLGSCVLESWGTVDVLRFPNLLALIPSSSSSSRSSFPFASVHIPIHRIAS